MSGYFQYQAQQELQALGQLFAQHQKQHEEEKRRKEGEAVREELLKFYSSIYDKASSFTTIIFSIGYAGFFTIWNSAKEQLPPSVRLLSAILVLISLFIFLAWEIYVMQQRNSDNKAMVAMLENNPENIFKTLEEYKLVAAGRKMKLLKYGEYSSWFTVYPGFAGGLIMLGALISQLFKQ